MGKGYVIWVTAFLIFFRSFPWRYVNQNLDEAIRLTVSAVYHAKIRLLRETSRICKMNNFQFSYTTSMQSRAPCARPNKILGEEADRLTVHA